MPINHLEARADYPVYRRKNSRLIKVEMLTSIMQLPGKSLNFP
jgi:hypothetical protein